MVVVFINILISGVSLVALAVLVGYSVIRWGRRSRVDQENQSVHEEGEYIENTILPEDPYYSSLPEILPDPVRPLCPVEGRAALSHSLATLACERHVRRVRIMETKI